MQNISNSFNNIFILRFHTFENTAILFIKHQICTVYGYKHTFERFVYRQVITFWQRQPKVAIVCYAESVTTHPVGCQLVCVLPWQRRMLHPVVASLGTIFFGGAKINKNMCQCCVWRENYLIFFTILLFIELLCKLISHMHALILL